MVCVHRHNCSSPRLSRPPKPKTNSPVILCELVRDVWKHAGALASSSTWVEESMSLGLRAPKSPSLKKCRNSPKNVIK
eukprot:115478-Amphidinium_carterae.1